MRSKRASGDLQSPRCRWLQMIAIVGAGEKGFLRHDPYRAPDDSASAGILGVPNGMITCLGECRTRKAACQQECRRARVDDSSLGLMSRSCLSALAYCINNARDISVEHEGRGTLLAGGFLRGRSMSPSRICRPAGGCA